MTSHSSRYGRLRKRDSPDDDYEQQRVNEPEISIGLSSSTDHIPEEVIYDFLSGTYKSVEPDDLLIHLLTLPSRILLQEEYELLKLQEKDQQQQPKEELDAEIEEPPPEEAPEEPKDAEEQKPSDEGINEALQELYGNVMSAEELARLDSQPNPFNFSERVSQTQKAPRKDLAIQTEPPPSNTYSLSFGLSNIFDAYQKDYKKILAKELELEREKEKEKERERKSGKQKSPRGPREPVVHLPPPPPKQAPGDLSEIYETASMVERMVTQNIYDDITQDFQYWEDTSDDFRPLEGSLLPLWKFSCDNCRSYYVSDICWNPFYPDLFAASYSTDRDGSSDSGGMLSLFTLKNPGIPERLYRTPSGVNSAQFHPTKESVLVAGCSDGVVFVYDTRLVGCLKVLSSTTITGKHLLPVSQVRWIPTEPGQNLGFYSVGQDGRVSQWTVQSSSLQYTDILDFSGDTQGSNSSSNTADKVKLEGTATCIAFSPKDKNVLLVGVDTGVVFQVNASSTSYGIIRYPAHSCPVRAIAWNTYHQKIFATCSGDWTLKLWLQCHVAALVILDLGAPVADLTWAPYSSSVVVAVSDDGRVHVYDLFLRKCRPLCVQNIMQRRRTSLACVAFNPVFPIIVVGGEKGYLISMKLSPNLRKPHKDAKGADEQKLREIELCKMDRIIATSSN
ncbi:dynein intermediate chain 2, ciliary-like [Macrobrachium rosenbergii]|uniref:dynein intermediate chain 2, ciliary-like n=1 Tax=Macrobrachium rosenbergii TaxID=79674 RepID=UPI0034D77F7D